MESKHVFEKLANVNVNSKTEKKGKFTYLSWAFAWAELKKVSPSFTSKVYHDENTNMPYFLSKAGAMVKVGVTVEGLEHINYLPVMDNRNNAIAPEKINMMDINNSIQRCTVKAIALHGLGLYIYAGEDVPEISEEDRLIEIEGRKPALKDSQLKQILESKNKDHAKIFLDKCRMSDDQRKQLKAV